MKLFTTKRSDSDVLEEVGAGAAAVSCAYSLGIETVFKRPAAVRGPMEKQLLIDLKAGSGFSQLYTEEQICRVLSMVMDHCLKVPI